MTDFTHIDRNGRARMVDVTDKKRSLRVAVARGRIGMSADTFDRILSHSVKKGSVLETARIAGVMAGKRTASLIPLCHPLNITHLQVEFIPDDTSHSIVIEAEARIFDRTGVEMEALTAVSVSALTIYDMCKSYDRSMVISDIALERKSGGKSGTYQK